MTDEQTPAPLGESIMRADDRPRPSAGGGTGLLTPEQARSLAQASVDAGSDPASIKAALAADGIEWDPDTRSKTEREWSQDHETGHPERYNLDLERHFPNDDPHERAALADVTRQFVAQLGFDRSGGSELAGEITKAMAEQRGLRAEDRAAYEQRQGAMLGSHRDQIVSDAAKALAEVHPDLVQFMRQAGALSNANVVVALAHMAQARAARG